MTEGLSGESVSESVKDKKVHRLASLLKMYFSVQKCIVYMNDFVFIYMNINVKLTCAENTQNGQNAGKCFFFVFGRYTRNPLIAVSGADSVTV